MTDRYAEAVPCGQIKGSRYDGWYTAEVGTALYGMYPDKLEGDDDGYTWDELRPLYSQSLREFGFVHSRAAILAALALAQDHCRAQEPRCLNCPIDRIEQDIDEIRSSAHTLTPQEIELVVSLAVRARMATK